MGAENYRIRVFRSYAAGEGSFLGELSERELLRYANAYRRRVVRFLPSGKNLKILDLACGNGKFIYFLLSLGYTNVRGVDVTPEVVAAATKITPNIVCEDALVFLKKHQSTFSMIVALDFLEHLKKKELFTLLDAIRFALEPGGTVLFRAPCADNPYGVSAYYNDLTHEIGLTSGCARALLSTAGFQDILIYPDGPAPGNVLQTLQWLLFKCYQSWVRLWRSALALGGGWDSILTPNMWIIARCPGESSF